MNDKDKKDIAEIVASVMTSKSRLEPHERLITVRECDIKHGQIMGALKIQAGKMEAVHTDVKGMQGELSETTRKINGHVSWHEGIKEEVTGEHNRTKIKWTKVSAIAKWIGVGILILSTLGSLAWTAAKMTSVAASVDVMNDKKTP